MKTQCKQIWRNVAESKKGSNYTNVFAVFDVEVLAGEGNN